MVFQAWELDKSPEVVVDNRVYRKSAGNCMTTELVDLTLALFHPMCHLAMLSPRGQTV